MILVHLLGIKECYGIIPRYFQGLKGVILAPLFHKNWEHLFNNAIPLLVLGFMVFSFYRKVAYLLFSMGWLITGLLVWGFADLGLLPSDKHIGCHIGASGIVYLLASFVFFSGIFRRSIPLIAISLIVVFLYGGMLWGIFPEEVIIYTKEQQNISWESHFFGALVGGIFAYLWRGIGPQRKTWDWNQKNYYNVEDEELWERYNEEFPPENEETEQKKTKLKDLF